MRTNRVVSVAVLGILALVGCTKVTVDPLTLALHVGETATLKASSTSTQDTSFAWSSSNDSVATVDTSGVVTADGEGGATITAEGSSSGAKGTASVIVTRPVGALSELSLEVDKSIVPPDATLPGLSDSAPPRPLAAIVDERGRLAQFVEDELLLVTNDAGALADFISRWQGEELASIDAGGSGLDMPPMHLVRINTALGDPSHLEEDILKLDPDSRGASRVSSDAGLGLISAGAHEAAAGLQVGMNWVGQGSSLASRSTTEAAGGPTGFSSAGPGIWSRDAFLWNYLDAGSTQDIGVTEAWYLLANTGRLANKVRIAILDMGFAVGGNLDIPAGWDAISNVPFTSPTGTTNLLSCSGGGSCPWHGTNVLEAAMAVPDNSFGAAGPAGPVADPIMVFTLYDFFTGIGAIVLAASEGAQVVNMSYGAPVPAILSWSVIPFDIATLSARSLGMLLFASAGNDGQDVDATDCFIVCWEETWWTPCENGGVICVGGIARNSKNRSSASNYGGEGVDIFGPYSVVVGPDPTTDINAQQKNGTSFSSPFVAGVAALIWAANPSLNANQVTNILYSTAHASPDGTVRRYVNAGDAVRMALGSVIHISQPSPGAVFHGGGATPLAAFVAEGGRGTATVTWTSNRDGVLGTGASISRNDLSVGTHTITGTALFGDAFSTSDSVTISVINDPPTVTITSPANGASFFQGQPVALAGTSFDANNGPTYQLSDAQLSWFIDGVLAGHGKIHTISAGTLSIGSHTIRFDGTDGLATDSESISITTQPNPADLPPDSVNITNPAHGASFTADLSDALGWYKQVTLQGNAHDPEDGTLTGASLEWRTSINGGSQQLLGTGTSLSVKLRAPEPFGNSHDITLTARDSHGNATSTSIRVTVIQFSK